jgi:hypothetical protein
MSQPYISFKYPPPFPRHNRVNGSFQEPCVQHDGEEWETLAHGTARHESTLGSSRQSQAMNAGVSGSGINSLSSNVTKTLITRSITIIIHHNT